jgi:hypothetical protein
MKSTVAEFRPLLVFSNPLSDQYSNFMQVNPRLCWGSRSLTCHPGCPATGPLRQQVHSNSGLAEYLGSSVGFVVMAMQFRRSEAWRPLWLFSSLFASVARIAA